MSSVIGLANIVVIFVFLGFWIVGFITLYHLTRFGVGVVPKRLAALFLAGAVLLFFISTVLFQNLDLNTLFS